MSTFVACYSIVVRRITVFPANVQSFESMINNSLRKYEVYNEL